jgi:Zn-dependent protease with chaperone function
MDFFSAQEAARKKTWLLIAYFVLAVAFIITGVYAALLIAWQYYDESTNGLWHPDLLLYTALGVLFLVLTGIIIKTIALSRGGEAIAAMLGGVPVNSNTDSPNERKLLNVVEEMSIASGILVPRVFILPRENGINAFAAGIKTSDAVVAVTKGCVEQLNREELQGVIGHEFSHILNGDMSLNVRLMGMIYGILIIASIGRAILRGGSRTASSSSSKKKGGGAWPIFVMALVLLTVGYIGVFFGRLIKAAVSREREFLADASAVQFTRNPLGIAGALKKIMGVKEGSRISHPYAEEASHFFFSNGVKSCFSRWLATHPPLEERIQRLDPSFKAVERKDRGPDGAAGPGENRVQLSPSGFAARVGSLQPEHLSYAEKLIADLPSLVLETSREPFGAVALACGLLLCENGSERKVQLDWLQSHAEPPVMRQVNMLMPLIDSIGRGYRLPLVDMAMPALKTLSPQQYRTFREIIRYLVSADQKVSLFEYALHRTLVRHLDIFFGGKKPGKDLYHTLEQVEMEAFHLLSMLAWAGNREKDAARNSFKQGLAQLGIRRETPIFEKSRCTLKVLDDSLERLGRASPVLKKKLIMACVACISHDRWVTLDEFEILRSVADSLDLPVPPVFPDKSEEQKGD